MSGNLLFEECFIGSNNSQTKSSEIIQNTTTLGKYRNVHNIFTDHTNSHDDRRDGHISLLYEGQSPKADIEIRSYSLVLARDSITTFVNAADQLGTLVAKSDMAHCALVIAVFEYIMLIFYLMS